MAVIGWNAAFLYDSEIGAETAIQLLEYANSQLLEFRHYDELLTRELEGVYASLDKGTGMLARWRMARDARKLHTVFLDVTELTEHADNAIRHVTGNRTCLQNGTSPTRKWRKLPDWKSCPSARPGSETVV